MYRTLIAVFLYTISVTGAPQNGGNSEITYVKIDPATTDDSTPLKSPYRESRIENLPLTIPGNVKPEKESIKPVKLEVSDTKTSVNDSTSQNGDDSVSEYDSPRKARSEDTTASYESDTDPTGATETYEEQTEASELKTKAPSPRFLSKLSYFKKNDEFRTSIATNLVDSGRRKFKSKCRCEKIWNCPKLQISVPRCPNEYFMCCF